jgi:predicted acyl esterase
LNPADLTLNSEPATAESRVTYEGLGDGVTFLTPPIEADIEITGPSAAKLFVSSETGDADLFLVLRVFSPDMREIVFQGAVDPHAPIGQGWLRASHRKLDPELSLEYRPYHSHDEEQSLRPGQVYELDVEIWPTCIVVPRGYRIGLSVRGKDYFYPGGGRLSNMKNEFTGCGPFMHDDPRDRPANIFGGNVTLHGGPGRTGYVVLPMIP